MNALTVFFHTDQTPKRPGFLQRLGQKRAAARDARQQRAQQTALRQQLTSQLAECRLALQQNESFFNMAEDADTVESCIWQHKALTARENMLTARLRRS